MRLPSLFCCLLLSLGCSSVPPPQSTPTPQATPTAVASAVKPGGVYSVVRGKEGGFTVVRVLVCEEGAVEELEGYRMWKNR